MKTVQIPECMNPFEVIVNNNRYSYPAGTEQTVPKEVAEVIDVHMKNHEERTAPPYVPGGGGGGATCKLKLTIDSSLVGWDSKVHLSSMDQPTINLAEHIGTMEVEVPCGSLIFAESVFVYPEPVNLTKVFSESYSYVFRAPAEPGGVAEIPVFAMG